MSETELGMLFVMFFAVMLVMLFWRQILFLMLSLVVTVFCFGVFCIIRAIRV
jgi:hypothetical protein